MVATQHISRRVAAVTAKLLRKNLPREGEVATVTSREITIPADERVSGQIERDRIMGRRVLAPKLPELELQLARARGTEQVSERRQGRVVSDLVAMRGWLACGGRDGLGGHSAGARYN